jgi:lipopolysaccharide/colanic/teichoic acid biosynthesis glycosyltransferase
VKNALIIGWNAEALKLCDRIIAYPALGYNIKGFISLNIYANDLQYKNIPLLGTIDTIGSWVKFHKISILLIAIRHDQHGQLDSIIERCRIVKVEYRIVGDVYDTVYGNVVKDIYQDLFRQRHFNFRRLVDIAFALFLMLLFFPIFLIIISIIKLESRGPIFYSQPYVGQNGRTFPLYKFRTMHQHDSDLISINIAAFDMTTRFGYFLQVTRLDEIPQLINIVKGDLGFVGPKPDKPFEFDSLQNQIPLYAKRLSAKPGVMGLAQLHWPYDETISDVKEKLKYDLIYCENSSLLLDLNIIIKSMLKLMA